ncbi:MAG: hypothetical protein HKN40_06640 [Winogradskyella sp.]|uniref:hypothetical protein n=1 Tax=Winogradskyella sp. TaxID=1883156 RepID=UPI0017C81463|nr:hypothetical protein [Winogradskyella sp.]
MNDYLHNTIPNLKPFVFERHHDSHFINQQWVLVNGISKKKATYIFREDNVLEIKRKDAKIKTSWSRNIKNIFTIETEDGLITVKAYFKDDDILVLNNQEKKEFALYINTTEYNDNLNSVDDIKSYLKEKYKKKVSSTIVNHEFYYIEKSEEFGPFKVEELTRKVEGEEISPYCFVRDINENDYTRRLRLIDLIQEV